MILDGMWTYRSFINRPALVGGDAQAALGLIFGEGIMSFLAQSPDNIRGGLAMGDNYAMTLTGREWRHDDEQAFALEGFGIDGTPTAGWRYDYRGTSAWTWPDGIRQVPCLVGSVIRVIEHGPTAPAGVTASFIAVQHNRDDNPRTLQTSAKFF